LPAARSKAPRITQINAETYLFVSKGDQPRIDVFALNASVTGLICTVSGNKN
jgi:hypothetical protein